MNLAADNINSSHLFRDGVFDLNSWIDFDKIDLFLLIDEKFDGSGIVIADPLADLQGVVIELVARLLAQGHAGSNFDHLLKAALYGTVALEKVHHVSGLITKYLHFNVLGRIDVFLQKHRIVAKGLGGFTARIIKRPLQFFRLTNDAHPPATAA